MHSVQDNKHIKRFLFHTFNDEYNLGEQKLFEHFLIIKMFFSSVRTCINFMTILFNDKMH